MSRRLLAEDTTNFHTSILLALTTATNWPSAGTISRVATICGKPVSAMFWTANADWAYAITRMLDQNQIARYGDAQPGVQAAGGNFWCMVKSTER